MGESGREGKKGGGEDSWEGLKEPVTDTHDDGGSDELCINSAAHDSLRMRVVRTSPESEQRARNSTPMLRAALMSRLQVREEPAKLAW